MSPPRHQKGFSLIELMISIAIGLLIISAALGVYLAQSQVYKTNVSEASVQNAENAISAFMIPILRSAGFSGCSTVTQVLSTLNAGGPAPLGNINTIATMLIGYSGTSALTQYNGANDAIASHWSPSLDTTLAGNAQSTSDVIVILGGMVGSQPMSVTNISSGANSLDVQDATGIISGQFGAVSDCAKTSIFMITGVGGTTITHAAGSGVLNNATASLGINYAPGAQFMPMQQTAFFIAQGPGGQSTLSMATMTGGTWSIQGLVPGVDMMLVQYGIGSNGSSTQYVTANAVTNWAQVYSLRLGFVIEGQRGSGVAQTQFTLLGNALSLPADGRLRHTFEITINLRNAIT